MTYIAQIKQEARLLNLAGDWRGLDAVLAELNQRAGIRERQAFYREMRHLNELREQVLRKVVEQIR